MARDPDHLLRFVEAQAPVFATVIRELEAGRKASHWMWFVFPQIAGLGRSAMAERYAIRSLAEAEAYLRHPILGTRLRQCTALVLAVPNDPIAAILGPPDDLKFGSCVTLFVRAAADEALFATALQRFFGGRPDPATLARLYA